MKITKSRLLQIIREEVEYHEKNTFELDENIMVELADENNDGKISKSEFEKEVEQDQKQKGLAEIDLEEADVEEDILFSPTKKNKQGKRPVVASSKEPK